MKVSRIREVKLPTRGTSKSAGIDFYIPKFTDCFIKDLLLKNNDEVHFDFHEQDEDKFIVLFPNERILIPSGIKVKVPEGYMLTAHNKSGIAAKKGLDRLAEVVDEDYQGEIHLSLVNTSKNNVYLSPNEKIIQFILEKVFYDTIEEVEVEHLYDEVSERGDGGFGSTNHK